MSKPWDSVVKRTKKIVPNGWWTESQRSYIEVIPSEPYDPYKTIRLQIGYKNESQYFTADGLVELSKFCLEMAEILRAHNAN